MRWMKWTGLAAAALMVIACFLVWVSIPGRQITVSGVNADGTSFGKPGYLHLLLTIFFIAFTLIPKLWAKRSNLLVTALNLAWVIRNFFVITACRGGDCPEKHLAIYLLIIAAVLMLVSALFPDMKLPEEKKNS